MDINLSGDYHQDLIQIRSFNFDQIIKLLSSYDAYNYALFLAELPHRNIYYSPNLFSPYLSKIPGKYRTKIVEEIINQGESIHQKNYDGGTALTLAARRGHQEIVRLLLDRCAYIHHQDNEGNTALIWAAFYGHQEIVKLLLDRGANINQPNNKGMTALMWAASNDHKEIVKLFFDLGVNINHQTNEGNTVLLWAASYGRKEIMKLLLNSVEPESFAEFSQLPTELQQENLTKLQAKVNRLKLLYWKELQLLYPMIRNKEELTPIVLAASVNNLDLVRFLQTPVE